MKMKKFAFLAMLLGSSFLYGCGEAPKTDKPKETPAAGAKEGETTKTPDATTPAADGEKKEEAK
jgi:hypothetical protein